VKMTSGISDPWQDQPTLCELRLALALTELAKKGVIGAALGAKRTALGELEAGF
jgi:hypothetical protein